MKLIYPVLFILILFSICSCKNAATIHITGRLDSAEGTKVKLLSKDFKTCYDSTIVTNGKFEFRTVTLPENGFYLLDFSNSTPWGKCKCPWGPNGPELYAENNADYIFKAKNPDDVLDNRSDLTSSSYTQNKLNEFNLLNARNSDSLLNLKQKCLKAMDNSMTDVPRYNRYEDTLAALEKQLRFVRLLTLHQFIPRNDSSIIVPYMITKVGDFFNDYLLYSKVLNCQSDKVKKSEYYKEAIGLVNSVDRIFKGGTVPELHGHHLNGKAFTNNLKKNKLTLINFWASWCGPCRAEIPDLKNIYQSFNKDGFDIIYVSIDEDSRAWKTASDKEKLPWTNISEAVDQNDSKNIENFVVKEIPMNYLVNADGKIINRNITLDSLRLYLKGNH